MIEKRPRLHFNCIEDSTKVAERYLVLAQDSEGVQTESELEKKVLLQIYRKLSGITGKQLQCWFPSVGLCIY